MTTPPVASPRRRAIPFFLLLAFACALILTLVAGDVITFLSNWAVWLGATLMALCLHWWLNWVI